QITTLTTYTTLFRSWLGFVKLKQINKIVGLNYRKSWTLKNLNVNQIALIKLYLPDSTIFDADLKKIISNEYDKFFELKNYKRFRSEEHTSELQSREN